MFAPRETIEVRIGGEKVFNLENDSPKDRLLVRMSYAAVDVQATADKVQADIYASEHEMVHAELLLDSGQLVDIELTSPIGTGNTSQFAPGGAGIVVVDVRLPGWFVV